ncbi:MAG TPA: response regulator [Tepidisphaeraceae bacterium]|jgi:CheY-like chemotaxis protein|nr:response regulator [Tepidisphaeraceae bacterium]
MPIILVVDDTALARESVAKLLEYEGFKTIRAANGKEAYATLYTQTPDLVLLDLMMPEMDGITFLRMIRHNPQWERIPVIVLTGLHDDNKLVARARELHVNDLVPKATFGFEDLLIRIRKAIGLRVPAPN